MAKPERTPLGALVRALRDKKRFSIRGLAEAAEISPAYVAQIENGFDPRTGKPIRPFPDVLRMLAKAFAGEDHPEDAEPIYNGLMIAAGYLDERGEEQPREVDAPATLDVALRTLRETDEIPDAFREPIVNLIEEARRIVRGESEP